MARGKVLIAAHLDCDTSARDIHDLLRRYGAGYSTRINNILRGSDVRSTIAAGWQHICYHRFCAEL